MNLRSQPPDTVDPQELWANTVSEAVFQTQVIHLAHEQGCCIIRGSRC